MIYKIVIKSYKFNIFGQGVWHGTTGKINCEELITQVSKKSSRLIMLPKVAGCLKKDYYVDKPTPIYHISKEVIRPYYLGWIIKKKTLWRNIINDHILRIQEVW